MRGDWQLLSWVVGKVPLRGGQRERNPLSALSRWKLFDNLRRSLVAPVLTLSLLLAWSVLPNPWFWTLAVLAVIFVPPLASSVHDLLHKPRDTLWTQHVNATARRSGMQFSHALLTLVFLPYESFFGLDAIARTLWRMKVSRRRMLQWRASALTRGGNELADYWRTMWASPTLALVAGVALLAWRPQSFAAALLFLAGWLAAPVVAWWISQPVRREQAALSAEQNTFLHMLARKTWAYFDTFVGPEDNWLPPDNMQEHPVQVIAHRTSPTNMGMALLANLSAHDFGYICGAQLVARTAGTLDAMARLDRHQGHFYNWYDTLTMKPLYPIYISTVDSGNLAGHLLTLQQGLLELADQPIVASQVVDGIGTSILVLMEAVAQAPGGGVDVPDELIQLQKEIAPLRPLYPANLIELHAWLKRAAAASAAYRLRGGRLLAPWVTAGEVFDANLLRIPTLRELAAMPQGTQSQGYSQTDLAPGERERQQQLGGLVAQGAAQARQRIEKLAELARQAQEFAQVEYGFLFNPTTKLLAIGYNVTERRLDASYYDLLASEVRLASFVAIAQGQLPQEHWFALGRQ
eukprot:gene37519-46290_t